MVFMILNILQHSIFHMLDKLALKNLMTPCSEKSIVEQIQPHILCPNECKCSIALGQQGPYGASTPHKKDEVEN